MTKYPAIVYYMLDDNPNVRPEDRRYFARVGPHPESPDVVGITRFTEWRLEGDNATYWIELHGSPIYGRLIKGETTIDEIGLEQVPLELTPATAGRSKSFAAYTN